MLTKKMNSIFVPDNCEWKNCFRIFLCSFIMAFVIFIPYIMIDKGIFLFYGDYNVQQIPFYQLAHDAIKNGNIGWNFNTDLGTNFIASYSFYLLGSPFFWLTIPFPTSFVPYLMGPLFILKFSLASVTGYTFIRRFTKTSYTAFIGGILYSYSSYMIYNIFYNHFLEVVIFFPLILIGLEELLINNNRGLFALSISINLFLNYYFFVADIVFLSIYFIVRIVYKSYKLSFKKMFYLIIEFFIGLLMGSLLFIPSAIMVLANPRVSSVLLGYNMIFYSQVQKYGLILQSLFFPPDMPAFPNFFPDADAKWYSVAAYIPLFGMSCVISFIKYKRHNFIKTIIVILLIMTFIPILNSSFNGFNSSFYTRWFYILTLFLSLATVISLEDKKLDLKYGIKINFIIILVFSLIGILPKKDGDDIVWFNMPNYPFMFWINILFALLGITIVYIIISKHYKTLKLFYKSSIIVICIFCIFYSSAQIGWCKFISSNNSYNEIVDKGINANFDLKDDNFYRIDIYNKDYTDNWAMFWKMPTIQAFQSTITPSIFEFYKSLGIERSVASRIPYDNYFGLRELLSVKYIFVENDSTNQNDNPTLPPGFSFYDYQNRFTIYKNEYFLPIGIPFDNYISENDFESIDGKQRDRLYLKGLLLNNDQIEKYKDIINETSHYQCMKLTDSHLISDVNNLKNNYITDFNITNNGFDSKISLNEDKLVLFSIPYDSGWTAQVNGTQVDIEKVDNGLMAIKCSKGENIIHFNYSTPGLKLSFYLTIIGAILYITYLICFIITKKQ